ncbi:MAG TPA: sigma factor-like helix-turn-helix DNA-binding protein [Terriglobales bacterium]|jgi:DNA-directed RNA polymerase specialized sigma24 family protein|nr:sigma factor-like helix-turn-helix DNA-binding protein [Terriglobales bacterium]
MTTSEVVPAVRIWQRVQMSRKCSHPLQKAAKGGAPACDLDPGLWIYRQRTAGVLQRYFRLSLEIGRLPSVLGREFFRTRFNQRQNVSFEDAVIFVHDVERCLEKLDVFSQEVLVWVVLQGYSQEEASRLLGCARRTVMRHLPEALDRLSEILLEARLL